MDEIVNKELNKKDGRTKNFMKRFFNKAPKNIFGVVFVFVVILMGGLTFTKSAIGTTAKTWDFSTPTDYTYDNAKIEVSSDQAQLKNIISPDWYNPNWSYRKEVTIDNSNNPSELSNYQINVDLTDSDFDYTKALPNGEDLRFTDSDGITELNSWIENYSLDTTTTVVNSYPTRTNTTGWWHLNSDGIDSSGNGNTGTITGSATYENNSLKFDGSTSYFSVPDINNTLDLSPSFTVEALVKISSLPTSGNAGMIITKGGSGDGTGHDHNYYLGVANNITGFGLSGPGVFFGFEDSTGTNYNVAESVTLTTDTWYHFVGVFNSVDHTLKLYRNGQLVGTTSSVTATPYIQNDPLYVGSLDGVSRFLNGSVKEARVLNTVLNDNDILEDYNANITIQSGVLVPGNRNVWVKVPLIPANSTKKIYLYYGLNTSPDLKAGLITDIHGVTNVGTKLGSNAITNINSFVSRMNSTVNPDLTVDMGDNISDVNHDTDIANLTSIKNAFSGLNNTNYYVQGNHDLENITANEYESALGIDYVHKSFDVGNYHVIILNANENSANYATGVGHISDAEKIWLTSELANTNKKTVVFVHQVLDGQIMALNKYFAGTTYAYIDNAADVRTILENSGKVIAVFNGHVHWDNVNMINNIPYITLNSLDEDNSKEWAEISIYNNQYLNIVYRQDGATKNFLVWDFVNNKWFNKGSQVFNLFDNFDGDSGQWSASGGTWKISQGGGYLRELAGGTGSHRLLKSTYSESTNYIAQGKINLYGGANVTGGFGSRITDISNFAALYPSSNGLYWAWKQMVAGVWGQVALTNGFTSNLLWHNIKLVKTGNSFNLYYDNVSKVSGTNSSLSDSFFGLWNFQNPIEYDNLFVRQYTTPEPINSLSSEVVIYSSDNPIIQPTSANSFTSLSGFSETATKNGGEIKYQISNDGGTTWYWYNSGWVTTTSDYTESNIASDINTNIATFPVGSGSFLFKAYLHSDGSQLVQLDSVVLTYVNDSEAPSTAVVSPVAGTYSTTQSVSLTSAGSDSIQYSTTETPATCSDGTLYTVPISVSTSQTIYVRACDSLNNSSTTSFVYVISPVVSHSSSGGSSPSIMAQFKATQQALNPIPTPTVTSAPSVPFTPIVLSRILKLSTLRMWGDDVLALQTLLNTKGYNSGTPDGNFGPKTQAAVIAFQKANGLVPDGSVGSNTLKSLNGNQTITTTTPPVIMQPTVTRILKLSIPRMIGNDVLALQTYLSTNRYDVGALDGVLGNKTKSAIVAFQTANGLTPDGLVGAKTLGMMK